MFLITRTECRVFDVFPTSPRLRVITQEHATHQTTVNQRR